MQGKLIVIEGTDGTGKETQTKLLGRALLSEGINLKEISFPHYGTTACGPVEMYLRGDFGKNPEDVSPYAATTLYAIDRFASYKMEWGNFTTMVVYCSVTGILRPMLFIKEQN